MWAKIRATPWETGEERTQALKGRTNRRSGGPRCHYLATVCDNAGCHAYRIGGTEDHVHILFLLSRTKAVSDLVEEAKTASSRWIKTKGEAYRGFSWQTGYGAFSIGQSQKGAVERYIDGQKAHHGGRDFKAEFRAFLHKYQVEYDERYVWD